MTYFTFHILLKHSILWSSCTIPHLLWRGLLIGCVICKLLFFFFSCTCIVYQRVPFCVIQILWHPYWWHLGRAYRGLDLYFGCAPCLETYFPLQTTNDQMLSTRNPWHQWEKKGSAQIIITFQNKSPAAKNVFLRVLIFTIDTNRLFIHYVVSRQS